jgi:hypothetical protein
MAKPVSEETFLEALKDVDAQHFPLEDAVTEHLETDPPIPDDVPTLKRLPAGVVSKQNFWGHPEAHPVVMHTLLSTAYGEEWLAWEAETFERRIGEDFPGVSLIPLNLSKIQAVRTLLTVDAFWERWEIFLACCMPFNDEFPDFVTMQVPTVAQVLVACMIAGHVRLAAHPEWSEELRTYVSAVYAHDGIWLPLPPANFVTLVPPEGLDRADLRKRCDEILHAGRPVDITTPAGVQVNRIVAALHYLDENRAQLTHQLGLFHV